MLVVPILMLFFLGADGNERKQDHADFSRFTKAIGAEIAIVDRDGIVREGLVTAASADELTLNFSGVEKTFARDAVASGERLKDGTRDGFIKGAIFGAVAATVAMQGYNSQGSTRGNMAAGWVSAVAVYGGIGWLIDAAQTNREPIYRSAAPAPSLKLSMRF
jgi:hypothetical protein